MKKSMFLLLLSLSLFASSNKHNDIRELLELTGSAHLGIQVMNQMLVSFKQAMPNVPEKFWNDLMKEVKTDDLIELIVPIYEKYFTKDDIKELIKFYKTPVGKKTIKLLPKITQESMVAGQEWGKKISEKVVKRLSEEGYK